MNDEVIELQVKLTQIQEALDLAMQADMEKGVDWLSESRKKEFNAIYPNISQVITNILEWEI